MTPARDCPTATRTLAGAARRIAGGEDPLGSVRDFLDDIARRTDDELAQLVRERPERRAGREADALGAGIVGHLAAVRHVPCPRWTQEEVRFLDRLWLVSAVPSFRATALAQTPVPLGRRAILWACPLAGARVMERDEIVDLLHRDWTAAPRRGLVGKMYVVGGAAIALAFDSRRSTESIDAVFEPKTEIDAIAGHMAEERGLRRDG